jgi:hypothetical protein
MIFEQPICTTNNLFVVFNFFCLISIYVNLTLKALLRGFEMVSGLKVNFHKSCLMGVNVSADFLEMASIFLNCKVGSMPFMYLGLPVGVNPKKLSTWEPVLERINARLRSWVISILV